MHPTSTDIHAYYAERASYYDAVYLKPERAQDIAFLSAHLAQRFAGLSVLEVACGTGYWTRYIAPAAKRMVATDGTAEPLEIARRRAGTERVAFRREDAYALPEDLGQFDAAFAGLWFSHVPIESRSAFLRSLHARLGPGARVIMIDNNEVQLREFPIVASDAQGNTYQHRMLRDGSVHRVLKNFPDEGELIDLFAEFGIRIEYRALQNFWLIEYVTGAAMRLP